MVPNVWPLCLELILRGSPDCSKTSDLVLLLAADGAGGRGRRRHRRRSSRSRSGTRSGSRKG